jgi:hypothetical protein
MGGVVVAVFMKIGLIDWVALVKPNTTAGVPLSIDKIAR